MVQIIPAILAITEEEYKEQLSRIEESGEFEWVHLDVMDGNFVESSSFDMEGVDLSTSLKMESHLMVNHPGADGDMMISEHISPGNNIKRLIFHIESAEVVKNPKDMDWLFKLGPGIESGVALNPETPPSALEPFISKVNVVLIMSVHPGKQGQEFIPESLDKIREVARLRSENNLNFKIGVDGGVSPENIKSIVEAGADYVVMGSHLIKGDIHANLESIWEALR